MPREMRIGGGNNYLCCPNIGNMEHFEYGEKEVAYLSARDKKLGEAIARIGMVERRVIPDLFSALVHSIIGQQISTKAHESIWQRVKTYFGEVTPTALAAMPAEELKSFGLSYKKVEYIQKATNKIVNGEFDIAALRKMDDKDILETLTKLDGVGVWTAEMLMLHSLQRPDVLSFGDLGIRRGMSVLYHHRELTREIFERHRRCYSPYGSVASIYLWEISVAEGR